MLKVRNDVDIDDNQSVFNRVWQYFIIERKPYGFNLNLNSCCYIDANDNRCAVGCLFTRESLREFRKDNADGVVIGPSVTRFFVDYLDIQTTDSFFADLQVRHDTCARNKSTVEEFKSQLIELASDYNLTVPE